MVLRKGGTTINSQSQLEKSAMQTNIESQLLCYVACKDDSAKIIVHSRKDGILIFASASFCPTV